MNDQELVAAISAEFGNSVVFCGGDKETDFDTALAFVRFVNALPPERIHPDDIDENTMAEFETNPFWSALALEYVFSDGSAEDHAEIVIEFFATLTEDRRRRAWGGVQTQIMAGLESRADMTLLEALAERSGMPIVFAVRPEPSFDNPPVMVSWKLMPQSKVTAELAAWAATIQSDPDRYPMHSSVSPARQGVLARVEWVPNASGAEPVRGVILYEPDEAFFR